MAEKGRGGMALIVGGLLLVILGLILWLAIDLFLLAFASILLALVLGTIGAFLHRVLKIPYALAILVTVLVLILLLVLVVWLSAPLISFQMNRLFETVPKVYANLKETLGSYVDFPALTGEKLTSEFFFNHVKLLNQITAIFSFTIGTLTSCIVFGLIGIYLAFNPKLYIEGFLKAFQGATRKRIETFLYQAGDALRWWLGGKFISMAIIGLSSLIGLWILDVPLAFVLALLAALFTFIPYLGAILSGIPAVLIAFSISPLKALYVVILYIIIHLIEGYLISPFVDQRTVSMPPALTILAQVVMALLVGFLGLAIASPLTVLFLLLVAELRPFSFTK